MCNSDPTEEQYIFPASAEYILKDERVNTHHNAGIFWMTQPESPDRHYGSYHRFPQTDCFSVSVDLRTSALHQKVMISQILLLPGSDYAEECPEILA